LPESFRVTLARPDDLDRVRARLEAIPEVELVTAYRDVFPGR